MESESVATSPGVNHDAGLLSLFWSFLKVGLTAFGGSTQAMMHTESVERRKWLDDKGYLSGFTISSVLPGANPVNLALYIGLQVRGALGATVAVCGMVVPAFCVIMLMGFLYREFGDLPGTHFVLGGVAAAGVGATLSVGVKVASGLERAITPALIAVAIFVMIGLLHWPMVPVVAVAVPLSVLAAYVKERRHNG
ncbi:MAG TPA: chromate transporter [Xanthobacteraceae bacterium]|jgi:chromate transporter|nr:chromate transporter [Xanthobacteraceae bacterium]